MTQLAVAVSGGVDSLCALLRLREQGHDVLALHGLFLPDAASSGLRPAPEGPRLLTAAEALAAPLPPASRQAVEGLQTACGQLGIPLHVADMRAVFDREVVTPFVRAYARGRTPNPCVDCNREIKFGALMDWALDHGMDALATGHYARVDYDEAAGRWRLLRGLDRRKDQSYFLFQLTQAQLAHLLLPVGGYEKGDIRALAADHGLENAQKPDSQDICFVPDGDYAAFLERQGVTLRQGNFVDASGRVLGPHRGLERYTTGQRKGLGVSAGEPVYVLRKDLASGDVVLGPDSALYTRTLTAERVNWISIPELTEPMAVTAKTRYSQREAEAVLYPLPGGAVRAEFREPQRAVTAGQATVFYDGEAVVGGGIIC